MMAAQKAAGKMAQGKRTDLGLPETQVSKPTLKEVNIDKNLAKSARKALPVESPQTLKLAAYGVRVAQVILKATTHYQVTPSDRIQSVKSSIMPNMGKGILLLVVVSVLIISCGNIGIVGDNQTIIQGDNVVVNYSAVVTPDGTTNGFQENADTGEQTATEIAELATTDLEYGLEFTDIVYSPYADLYGHSKVYLNFLLRNIGSTVLSEVDIICRFNYADLSFQYHEYHLDEDIAPGLLNVESDVISAAWPTSIEFLQITVNNSVLLSLATPYVLYPNTP